jgi:hypothetical protein
MSAVLKPKKLETIFDHNATASELEDLLGYSESESDYLNALSSDDAYADLYFLYSARGDEKTAKAYLDKIKDASYRMNISLPSCVC